MPVHNGASYLEAALRSILDQDFGDFEFLIVDDGSTDATPDILARTAATDPRLRVISRAQRGLVESLNELLHHARGEFVARMDADDIALPHRLTAQAEFLRQHPKVVCIGGATMMIDEGGRYLTTLYPPTEDNPIQAALLAGHTAINHPSAMIRRTALETVGAYDAAYYPAEDLDLWLRLGEVGALANLPMPVLQYRLHDQSISAQGAERQHEAKRRACEAAWRRRGIAGRFTAQSAWRPGRDRHSRGGFMTQYGWWAWRSGERATAIRYGWRAICADCLAPAAWKLLLVAMLRSPRRPRELSSSTGAQD